MLLRDLTDALQIVAPPHLAEPWDNTGLLLGDPSRLLPDSSPVLLTIDLTHAVLDEAQRLGARAVVAYHPPIFQPLTRIDASTPRGSLLLRTIEMGLAVYSPHTALDAAPDAMTDWLADSLLDPPPPSPRRSAPATASATAPRSSHAGADRRALAPAPIQPENQQVKIVTFVPADKADDARSALASAGAGHIRDYSLCSFSVSGEGTFLGGESTRPAVGRAGRLERVSELRLEMVCSRRALALALTTLRQFHPYEEPAIDVYPLEPHPDRAAGIGRRLTLDTPTPLSVLARRVRSALRVAAVHVGRPARSDADPLISRVAVCCGAGSSLISRAAAESCQLFLAGELKHHDTLAALDAGLCLILAGHTATERGYLPVLAARLAAMLPALRFHVADADTDPLTLVT